MATETEEFLMRMGFNADAVTRGTTDMLARQRRASQEYVGFWQAAMREREVSEVRSAERIAAEKLAIDKATAAKSWTLYQANVANKKALDEAWLAERAAQLEIAATSGGFGSEAGRIENARLRAGGVASAAGHGAGGVAFDSTARREMIVMTRELFSGNYKRFFSSFTIFLQHMGGAVSLIARLGGILAAVITAGEIASYSIKARRAAEESNRSNRSLTIQGTNIGSRVEDVIYDMLKNGKITKAQADAMLGDVHSNEGIRRVQRQLLDINDKSATKNAEESAQKSAYQKRIEDSQKELDNITEKEYTAAEYAKDEQARLKQNEYLRERIAKLDKDSVESAHLQSIVAENNLQIEKDKVKVRQELEKLQDKEEKIRAKMDANKKRLSESAAEYPALSDLAGRDWTKAFAAQYGKGGQFDLGLGNGPLAELAREATRAKYQQIWDRTYGNTAMAEQDRVRQMNALSKLSQYGAASPEQNMQLVAEQTRSMANDLQSLIKQEAELAVNLKGVEDKP